MSGEITKPGGVYRTELFDQHSGPVASKIDLGSEGSGTRRTRRGGNEHDRSREELVCLDDNTESISVLLASD
jgi:hypothetical protein